MTEETQNNQTPLDQQVEIDAKPPAITDNFDALEAALDRHLEQYKLAVSAEGVKDAKKAATEINQLGQQLDERIKAVIAEIRAPIDALDARRKQLLQKCKDARSQIKVQVDAFESQQREQIKEQLIQELLDGWNSCDVRDEHRRATVGDLVKLTAVTGKGKLTTATVNTVMARATEDKQRQDKVDRRLLELENRSYRAGLHAPLTGEYVSHIIELPDEKYEPEIERILAAELKREEQAAQRRRQMEERQQAQAPAPDPAPAPEEKGQDVAEELATTDAEIEAHDAATVSPNEAFPAEESLAEAGNGRVTCEVTARFRIEVTVDVTDAEIEAECRRMMDKAGITTLAGVQVRRQ